MLTKQTEFRIRTHTCIYKCMHKRMHTYMHTCMHTCMHIFLPSPRRAHTHTHTHTHTRTHTKSRMCKIDILTLVLGQQRLFYPWICFSEDVGKRPWHYLHTKFSNYSIIHCFLEIIVENTNFDPCLVPKKGIWELDTIVFQKCQ